MAELGFVGGSRAGIHRRWLNWDLVVGELAPGFVGGAKVGIVGGHRGGICMWLPSWDSLSGTEQGLLGGCRNGICWRSRSWVLLAGVEIMKGKLIET